MFFYYPIKLDDCPEKYACFNTLYEHLITVHPGTYKRHIAFKQWALMNP